MAVRCAYRKVFARKASGKLLSQSARYPQRRLRYTPTAAAFVTVFLSAAAVLFSDFAYFKGWQICSIALQYDQQNQSPGWFHDAAILYIGLLIPENYTPCYVRSGGYCFGNPAAAAAAAAALRSLTLNSYTYKVPHRVVCLHPLRVRIKKSRFVCA